MPKFTLVCDRCSHKSHAPTKHGDPCKCGGKYEEAIIRLKRNIRSDFMLGGAGCVAKTGEHKALMNVNGAVSVESENGRDLGVMPEEMDWVQGMPDGWCGMSKFGHEPTTV